MKRNRNLVMLLLMLPWMAPAPASAAPVVSPTFTTSFIEQHAHAILVWQQAEREEAVRVWTAAVEENHRQYHLRLDQEKAARAEREAASTASAASTAVASPKRTPAPARSSGVSWDAIAQCESGQRWNLNTGNGYYGGLQFSLSTWRAYGGTGYPHETSREGQIAIASGMGLSHWPTCGSRG